jgi:PAS domain S-box-containing protein
VSPEREDDLRAEHERLSLALAAAELGTWELRPAARDVRCDPLARSLLGLPPAGDVSYDALLARLDARDRATLERAVSDALSGEGERRLDEELRGVEAPLRWLEVKGRATLTPSPRLVGTVADITDRKQREARADEGRRINAILLRVGTAFASELQHDRLVQVITDEATQLSEAEFGAYFENATNERGEVYLLYTLSGAPREAFSKFPAPRATAIFGPTFRGEGIVRFADVTQDPRYGKNPPYHGMPAGHLPVRSYLAAPVRSRSGRVLGGLFFGHSKAGVFTEEHERLISGLAAQAAVALDNAELYRALRDGEQRFRQLADAMPQIVWTARADGTSDYYNRRWYEFSGRPEGETGDESFTPVLHPDDVARTIERWRAAVRSGEPYEVEYRFRDHRTGEFRWHLGRALPVRDEQGRIARWFGTSTDIHEQKEAVRARDVFLSIASHELRTPLTPLTLQLQRLERLVERAPQGAIPAELIRDKVAMAERQVEHINRLVDTLLDVSRLTENRLEPTLEEVDLAGWRPRRSSASGPTRR